LISRWIRHFPCGLKKLIAALFERISSLISSALWYYWLNYTSCTTTELKVVSIGLNCHIVWTSDKNLKPKTIVIDQMPPTFICRPS
jgi:hypothetical protein